MGIEINTVQAQPRGGWIVNGGISVPDDLGNRHARAVHEWIDAGGRVVDAPKLFDPVPPTITFRQLVLAAAAAGWITEQEADDWAARNARPQVLDAVIAGLPDNQQLAARVTALTMDTAKRADPLLAAAAAVAIKRRDGEAPTDTAVATALDDFFRTAAAL